MKTEDASQYLSDANVLAAAQALLQSVENSEDEDDDVDPSSLVEEEDEDDNGAGLSLLCEVACGRIVESAASVTLQVPTVTPSVTLQVPTVTSPILTHPNVTSPTLPAVTTPSLTLQYPTVTSPTVISQLPCTEVHQTTNTIQNLEPSVTLQNPAVRPSSVSCPSLTLQWPPAISRTEHQTSDVQILSSTSFNDLIHELQPRVVPSDNSPSNQTVQNMASSHGTITPGPSLNHQDTASILLHKHSSVPFTSVTSAQNIAYPASTSSRIPAKRPLKLKNKQQPKWPKRVRAASPKSGGNINANESSPLVEDAVAELPKLRSRVRLDYSKLDGPDEDEGDLADYIRHQPAPTGPVSSLSSKRRRVGGDIIMLTESIIASPHLAENERKLYQWYRDLKTSRISLTYNMLYNMTKSRFPDCANQTWLLSFIDKFNIEFS